MLCDPRLLLERALAPSNLCELPPKAELLLPLRERSR